jgi:hypothetical protein
VLNLEVLLRKKLRFRRKLVLKVLYANAEADDFIVFLSQILDGTACHELCIHIRFLTSLKAGIHRFQRTFQVENFLFLHAARNFEFADLQ